MKKKFLLTMIAMVCGVSVWAYDFKSGDLYYNITSDSTVKVTCQNYYGGYDYYGNSLNYPGLANINIPEKVNYNDVEYVVTSIGYEAFNSLQGLVTITIPNSILNIEERAFYNSWLQYNEYDNALYLGNIDNPYYALIAPKSTDIVSCEINNNCKIIAGGAFKDLRSLTSVTIPNTVTNIGYSAFSGCSGLTTVIIPNTIKNIDISLSSFDGCGSLQYNEYDNALYLGNSENPFVALIKAKSQDTTSCEINNNCKIIAGGAFRDLRSLTSVTIPNSVTNIGESAFSRCGLTTITIPNSVTNIGRDAFSGNDSLVSITITSAADFSGSSLFFEKDSIRYKLLNKNEVEVVANSYTGGIVIPETVTLGNTFSVVSIGDNAFSGCRGLTTITIPNSVTNIGKSAFSWSGLTTITIPNSVTNIGEFAFSGCGLTTITIPNSVTNIGSGAFSGCRGLTTITIPNSVTNIGESAFSDCGLTTITIPNSVENIGSGAFSGNDSLVSITITSAADFSGSSLFFEKDSIRYKLLNKNEVEVVANSYTGGIVIPETVTLGNTFSVVSIGDNAFSGCRGLTTITIPNSVTNIGGGAFSDCRGLTTITIPNSVTNIGYSAFWGCSSLTSVTIPNSVTEISENAFYDCSSLIFVSIPNTVSKIGLQAFWGCRELSIVNIPESVTNISRGAFAGCTKLNYLLIPESVANIEIYAFEGVNIIIYSGSAEGSPWGASRVYSALDEYGFVYTDKERAQLSAYIGYNMDTTSITIPKTVQYIGCSFSEFNNLTSIIVECDADISGAQLYFSKDNFRYRVLDKTSVEIVSNTNTGEVIIPETVTAGNTFSITSIGTTNTGYGAFQGSEDITSITIPNTVAKIGDNAFANCKSLKSISFGTSVTEIGYHILAGCDNLQSIVCEGSMPPIVCDNSLTANGLQDAILYSNVALTYPQSVKMYRKMQPWCNFDTQESVTEHVVDTIYSIDTICKIDTIYVVGTNATKYNLQLASANTKMGMAIGSGSYASGSVAEIVAIEKYGYHFTKWSDGNTENPRFVNVTSDSTFTAQFEVNNYTVLAEANEKEMGKVEGAAEYAYLSRTQLKAVPNTGYKFAAWSDGETANPREILVYCDTSFTAVFEVAGTETVSAIGESAAQVNIYVTGNTIVVENASDEIFVYNAMGALVGRDAIHRVHAEIIINNPGVYIVKTGNKTQKVVMP